MKLSRLLIGLLLVVTAAGAISQPKVYRNKEFGIRLPIPAGTIPCIPPIYVGNGIDHGPQILLGTKDASLCSKSSGKRYIDIWAAYSTTDEDKTLHSYLESWCASAQTDYHDLKASCGPAPPDLNLSKLPTESARINLANGLIVIDVVTQAGKPAPDWDPTVPSISYLFSLVTDAQHLDKDLIVFRTVLKAIRIAPDR